MADSTATAAELRQQAASLPSTVSSSHFSTVSESAVLIRPQSGPDSSGDSVQLDKLYARITWHVMPLFLVVMVLNHVDRTNLAYASITMNADLHIGPATYGLGSALFFIPFCIFQIPSNLVVARVGARRWLSFLLLGWGTVATCMSLIHNVPTFFALRILLGAFEAGAVPAMWYHLSSFYPGDRVTKPYTLLTIGILVAQAVSGPVAAAFLSMNGLGGLHGWQWLFLLEGLPTVMMSAVVWFCLPDSPGCATWLSASEKKMLEWDLAQAAHNDPKHVHGVSLPSGQHRSQQQHLEEHGALKLLRTAVCNPWLLYLCFMGVLLVSASNTYVFFLPMIINALLSDGKPAPAAGGTKNLKLLPVILTCIPYTVAAVTSWLVAHSSQKRKELYMHTAIPAMIGGVFFVLFPFLSRTSSAAGFASLAMVAVSGACSIGPKTAIVHQISAGPSQVVGMPMYNSIIVLGGFAGPFVTGQIVQRTGNFTGPSVLFGVFLLIVGSMLIFMKLCRKWLEKRATAKSLGDMRNRSDAGMVAPPGTAISIGMGGPASAGDGKGGAGGGDAAAAADGGGVVVQQGGVREAGGVRPRPVGSAVGQQHMV